MSDVSFQLNISCWRPWRNGVPTAATISASACGRERWPPFSAGTAIKSKKPKARNISDKILNGNWYEFLIFFSVFNIQNAGLSARADPSRPGPGAVPHPRESHLQQNHFICVGVHKKCNRQPLSLTEMTSQSVKCSIHIGNGTDYVINYFADESKRDDIICSRPLQFFFINSFGTANRVVCDSRGFRPER